jgi:hypothetical protein
MGVKSGDLVARGLRQLQLIAQRAQMSARDAVIAILDQMEVLNQKIMAAWTVTQ